MWTRRRGNIVTVTIAYAPPLGAVQLSIVASAEGARAAFGIDRDLTREDFASGRP